MRFETINVIRILISLLLIFLIFFRLDIFVILLLCNWIVTKISVRVVRLTGDNITLKISKIFIPLFISLSSPPIK